MYYTEHYYIIKDKGIKMATFETTLETITVFPHPNADLLELARVGLYNVVVKKDQYKTGDQVLYIPEFAVLPENLIVALGLEGKLAGSQKNRVKPVRLRGEISQGLVAPLSVLPHGIIDGTVDYSSELGVVKYDPPVPVHLAGNVKGSTELVNWIDIENIKKFPDMFSDGEEVHITEKIHGTASLFTVNFVDTNYSNGETEILISSKGLGSKQLVIQEEDKNVYWRAFRTYGVETLARKIALTANKNIDKIVSKVGIFGETFGSGVQDLHYGFQNKIGFAVFDAFVAFTDGTGFWVSPTELESTAATVNVPTVPTLYVGPFSLDIVIKHAYGKETISGKELHVREGVVVRPTVRPFGYSDGSKQIGKYVSDDYLLRKGNTTEYQ